MNRQAAPTQTDSPWPHRVRSSLLLSACAEVIAAPFSGKPVPENNEVNTALMYPEPVRQRPALGYLQTLVVAEHFASGQGKLDEDGLASALAAYHRQDSHGDDPAVRAAYHRQDSHGNDPAVRAAYHRQDSHGNDPAVRAAPIGLLPRTGIGAIADLARRSARATHSHPLAGDGASVHAVAVALAAHQQPSLAVDANRFLVTLTAHAQTLEFRAALGIVRTLTRHRAGPAEAAATVGHDSTALRSVPAALVAYLRYPEDPFAAIRYAILVGGDAPAIAAMTGALAGARNATFPLPTAWSALVDTAAVGSAATALSGIGKP